jgi:type II secretory pathway pseudopilin PulG
MTTRSRYNRIGTSRWARQSPGWTFPELLTVVLLIAVVMGIAALSVYRGKAAASELACQDNMGAIHSALQIYWTKNGRTYPPDQAAFELFLCDRTYFTEEPRCPLDDAGNYHYQYSYNPAVDPGPEGIVITCPVSHSGHGSM